MAHETETDPCVATGAHDHKLVLDRIIDAPPEKIWKAWMTPEILAQWFCPKPWSISNPVVEPEVGGRFAFTMHGPGGEVMPNDGVFLAVEPNRRWVTTDAFVKGWLPAGAPFMAAEVVLTPLPDGKTRYVATARHWNAETMKQHEAMGFNEGWGTVADQLNALVKTFYDVSLLEPIPVETAAQPTLRMSRVFDAPRSLVWKAWSQPELMVHWLGPVEWPAVSATLDFRVGGEWRACLRSPDTQENLWQGGVYTEIVEPRLIVFTFKWDESHEDGPPVDTLVTVELTETADGRTRMDFTHEGLKSEQSLTGHRHGWTSTADRLEAWLAANPD